MKDLSKSALNIIGILFAGLLLSYTGYQTFSLLLEVSGSPLIAAIGLIMFEVGMLYWWQVFRNSAEGLMQMALSFLVFIACLTFVVMATALKLGAVDAGAGVAAGQRELGACGQATGGHAGGDDGDGFVEPVLAADGRAGALGGGGHVSL